MRKPNFRIYPKPNECERCKGKRFVPRGGLWGCLECGLWNPDDGKERTVFKTERAASGSLSIWEFFEKGQEDG